MTRHTVSAFDDACVKLTPGATAVLNVIAPGRLHLALGSQSVRAQWSTDLGEYVLCGTAELTLPNDPSTVGIALARALAALTRLVVAAASVLRA